MFLPNGGTKHAVMESKKQRYIKSGIYITLIVLLEKALGFFREILQAYYFGTSDFVDAISSASMTISIFFGWMSSIGVVFTPIYKRGSIEHENDRLVDQFLSLCYTLSFVSFAICLAFSKELVMISLPGFSPERKQTVEEILKVLSITLLFSAAISIRKAYFSCKNRYVTSAWPDLCINAVQIIALLAAHGVYRYMVALGIMSATVVEWLVTMVLTRRMDYHFHFQFPSKALLKEIGKMIVPVTLTYIIGDICNYFDRMFASFLAEGSISAISYANSLRKLVLTVITTGLTTIIYPELAELAAKKDYTGANRMVHTCVKGLLVVVLPIIICFELSANNIVSIVFERGTFSSHSTILTGSAFMAYIPGVLFMSIEAVYTRFFYAAGMGKNCTILSLLTVIMNICLNALLIGPMKHTGLALATTLSTCAALPFYYRFFRSTVPNTEKKALDVKILLAAFCTAVVAVFAYWLERTMNLINFWQHLGILAANFLLCEGAFIGILIVLRDETVNRILRVFRARLMGE